MSINGILLDIEGTVGSISFVHNVLFPYSAERMLDFLRKNPPEESLLDEILEANQKDFNEKKFAIIENKMDPQEINAYLQFLIREDRKFGPLKLIQGKIWKEGFELGDLKAELFDDVPEFLEMSVQKGCRIFIYSSGSTEAQRLYFKYSVFSDLGKWLDGYFDMKVGAKQESDSYREISRLTGISVEKFVFFTDIVEEANAAKSAGFLESVIMNRPGNKPQGNHNHKTLDNLLSFWD